MNMDPRMLLSLFGHYAAYADVALFIALAVIIVIAFRQGRPISIGSIISVGPRPQQVPSKGAAAGGLSSHELPESCEYRSRKADKVFEPSEAKEFYGAIAPYYDERNSLNLIATHMETTARIEKVRAHKAGLRILDLGGGTGQYIATCFSRYPNIQWTYVDFCPAMKAQLLYHLAGRPLARNLKVYEDDINRVHMSLPAGAYDVIVMSLVLTSMPVLPDFSNIAKLLAPNGKLIISDINPLYTELHPLYQATVRDGEEVVAMRMKAVNPLQIAGRAEAAGLHQTEIFEIKEQFGDEDISYSFITTFVSCAVSRPRRAYLVRGRAGRN
jgi:SAM-dependent methyltransferase